MADTNAYLVKSKLPWYEEMRIHLAGEYILFDQKHQLFVPERFVLGHFKEREKRMKFMPGEGIFYEESEEILGAYQAGLDKKELIVVASLVIPSSDLTTLEIKGRAYRDICGGLNAVLDSVERYSQQ